MENMPDDRALRGSERSMAVRRLAERSRQCEPLFPGLAVSEAANDVRMSQLARTIEEEIIPRLMLAHRTAPAGAPAAAGATVEPKQLDAGDVEHFAKLVLDAGDDVALDSVHRLRLGGVPIDAIYLDLLAPTARFLGHLWVEDLCDFTDVTVGLGRLQRVLRELSPGFGRIVPHPFDGRRALLLPCPGEQHTFGLSMVAEFFRHAGWDVAGETWGEAADAASRVAAEWFDVAGFSLSAEVHLPALEDAIRGVRHATCNRHLSILVGGAFFIANPDQVDRVGADGMTIDAREAPALAERLIARSAGVRVVAQARRRSQAGAVGVGR